MKHASAAPAASKCKRLFRVQHDPLVLFALKIFGIIGLAAIALFFFGIFSTAQNDLERTSPIWGTAALLCFGLLLVLLFFDTTAEHLRFLEVYSDDTLSYRSASGEKHTFPLGEVAQARLTASADPRNLLLISAQGGTLAEVHSGMQNFRKLEQYLIAHGLTPSAAPQQTAGTAPYVELQIGEPNSYRGNALLFALLLLSFLLSTLSVSDEYPVLMLFPILLLAILLFLILYQETGALLFYSDGTFTTENWRGVVRRHSLQDVRGTILIANTKITYLRLIDRSGQRLAQINSGSSNYEALSGYLKMRGIAPISHDPSCIAGPPPRAIPQWSAQQIARVRRTMYFSFCAEPLLLLLALILPAFFQNDLPLFFCLSILQLTLHAAMLAVYLRFYPLFHMEYPNDCILYKQRQQWNKTCIRFPIFAMIPTLLSLVFSLLVIPALDRSLEFSLLIGSLLATAAITLLFIWRARQYRRPWAAILTLASLQFIAIFFYALNAFWRIQAMLFLL